MRATGARIRGTSLRPKVFREGSYTIKVGEKEPRKMKTIRSVKAGRADENQTLEVAFWSPRRRLAGRCDFSAPAQR